VRDADVLTLANDGTIEPEAVDKSGTASGGLLGLAVPNVRRQHPERCF
jgi:hypothetical protein